MDRKLCPDCRIELPVTEFSRNAARGDGLQFYCKRCYSERSRRAYRDRRLRNGLTLRGTPEVPAAHKYCPSCERILPFSEWHNVRSTKDGLASHCKDCRRARGRRDYLKRTFGITEEERQALFDKQGGLCAICDEPNPEHLDHDHVTGRIRGLLCSRCNMGLGLFGDDVGRLRRAIGYLADNGSLVPLPDGLVVEIDAYRHRRGA